jgi:hypothetical protein
METDGVLAMVRWLDCPLEKFIAGAEATAREHFQIPPGSPQIAPQTAPQIAQYRFSCRALYAALDRQRQARGISWTQLARELGGIPPGMLTRLKNGGRIGTNVMIPAVAWLRRTVESFAKDPSETGRVVRPASSPARIP